MFITGRKVNMDSKVTEFRDLYTPTISIIVPTYNRAEMLRVTIDSFIAQDYPKEKFEIIIANNNSTDNTEQVAESYLKKSVGVRVKYLFEARQGVHYARNTAAKHSASEILYFTDDDMIARTNLLTEIVKPFSMDNRIATVTGKVLPKWEIPPPRWVLELCYNAKLSLNDRKEDLIISTVDCGIFSCHQAIRREAFFDSGGFNPENTAGIWVGDGETGLNIKIKELGYKFAYIGSSVIFHMIPPSRMTQSYLNRRSKNQGACASYAAYKKNKFTKYELIGRLPIHLIRSFLKFTYYLMSSIWYRDSSWRLSIAQVFYSLEQVKYEFKLIVSPKMRDLVLKYNWLED